MNPPRQTRLNVVLIGFMGSGKTTIGSKLAATLGFQFVDTDEAIAARTGKSIPDIFKECGEAGFRALETETLGRLAAADRQVISTGGGIVTVEENHLLLKNLGCIVWLTTSDAALWNRVRRNRERPMLHTSNPRETFRELLEKRRPLYAALADFTVDTRGLSPEEAAYGIGESVRVFFSSSVA